MKVAPTIATQRLRLEPFDAVHLTPAYVRWLNDEQVVAQSEQRHTNHTLESCEAYWRSYDGTPHEFRAIVRAEDHVHIGNISAHVDEPNGVADIAILIGARDAWGQGFGSEAFAGLSEYMFGFRGMRKVTAGTAITNEGMRAIMRKCGMTPDGTRTQQFVIDGQPVDLVHGSIFAESSDHLRGSATW